MKPEGYNSKGKAPVIPLSKEKIFDYFFRQYYAALCFFAQSIIHHPEDAKDLVQDCFVKLWDDATAIKERTDTVKSFLYTMVHNRCINYIRNQKVRTKATNHLQITSEGLEYFDELSFAEMIRQVLEYIEDLPTGMSIILKKYYLQGKKYKDIANELSTTPDAVRMQKTRAIKLLKEKFLFFIIVLMFL